jgi:hypothetical protein
MVTFFFHAYVTCTNIKETIKQLNYQTTTYNGKGTSYLWFHISLQILFIV